MWEEGATICEDLPATFVMAHTSRIRSLSVIVMISYNADYKVAMSDSVFRANELSAAN